MTLIEKIQEQSIAARKAGDKTASALLTTLFAEAQRVGKDRGNRPSTDDEVVETIRKFVKNAEEVVAAGRADTKEKAEREIEILRGYLPQAMTEQELRAAVAGVIATLPEKSSKAMGQVMAHLKATYPNRYDGKLANQIVKESLAG